MRRAALLLLTVPAAGAAAVPERWEALRAQGGLVYTTDVGSGPPPNFGNGYMAAQWGAKYQYIAGVFNGRGSSSARASIPATGRYKLKGPAASAVALDWERAAVELTYGGSNVTQRTYAHRGREHVMVTEFACSTAASLDVADAFDPSSGDISFEADRKTADVQCVSGANKSPEGTGAKVTVAICHAVAQKVPCTAGQVVQFVTTVWTSMDNATDPAAAAYAEWKSATAADDLWETHSTASHELWSAGIEIKGATHLARFVNSSMYQILIGVREGVYWSTSIGGLACDAVHWPGSGNCYGGHTLWDVEQYIWPSLNMFHPGIARDVLRYRFLKKGAAEKIAKGKGDKGLRFPWESAATGAEVDPYAATEEEIHLTADVSFAHWKYWQASRDEKWLRTSAWPLLSGIADFWEGRVKGGHIGAVCDVDEDHHSVTDSVYTNAGARLALRNAGAAAALIGEAADPKWAAAADSIKIPFDKSRKIHEQWSGAGGGGNGLGVVLLSYPLDVPMKEATRRSDLDHYVDSWSNPNAMQWWSYVVGYLQVGLPDKAATYLKKATDDNCRGPFLMWSENYGGGGCPCFNTGAGGYLQGMWAGYAGARLGDDGVHFLSPRVPPGARALRLRRLAHAGRQVDVDVTQGSVSFALSAGSPPGPALRVAPPTGAAVELSSTPQSFPSAGNFLLTAAAPPPQRYACSAPAHECTPVPAGVPGALPKRQCDAACRPPTPPTLTPAPPTPAPVAPGVQYACVSSGGTRACQSVPPGIPGSYPTLAACQAVCT